MLISFQAFSETLDCSRYAMIASQRQANPEETSFLWSITSAQGAQSYLVGTFHESDGRIRSQWESLNALLSKMKAYVSEADFSAESSRELARLGSDPSFNLEQAIGANFFAAVSDLLKPFGLQPEALRKLKPWSVFLRLAQDPNATTSLDGLLFGMAKDARLNIVPLQTAKELVTSIEGLSAEDQIQIVRESVCNISKVREQSRKLGELYASEDVAGFVQEAGRWQSSVPALTEKFDRVLLEERNVQMVNKLEPLLNSGSTFVAVGASHLFGERGLVTLLKQKGFTVQPLDRKQQAKELLQQANQASAGLLPELLQWLNTSGFAVPPNYTPPALQFVPASAVDTGGCEDAGECDIALQDKQMNVSVRRYLDLKTNPARLKSEILTYLIRDIQSESVTDKHCAGWQVLSVQGMIWQSRYLAQNGLPPAGLRPLPKLDCMN